MTMPLYALIAVVGASAPTQPRDLVHQAFLGATVISAARPAASKAPVMLVVGAATPVRTVTGLDGLFRTRPSDPSAVPGSERVLASSSTKAKPLLRTRDVSTIRQRPAVLMIDKVQQLRRIFTGCSL